MRTIIVSRRFPTPWEAFRRAASALRAAASRGREARAPELHHLPAYLLRDLGFAPEARVRDIPDYRYL